MSEDTSTSAYTATLKGGASFDSPWLVVRADTADDLADLLNNVSSVASLLTSTAKSLQSAYSGAVASASQSHSQSQGQPSEPSPWDEPTTSNGGFGAGPTFGGQVQPQAQPSAGGPNPNMSPKDDPYYQPKPGTAYDAQPAPQGPPGDKSGIPMVWRTGNGQRGPWRAWMSAQDRNTPAHLKDSAIFIK